VDAMRMQGRLESHEADTVHPSSLGGSVWEACQTRNSENEMVVVVAADLPRQQPSRREAFSCWIG
jgi:hypothetical protein